MASKGSISQDTTLFDEINPNDESTNLEYPVVEKTSASTKQSVVFELAKNYDSGQIKKLYYMPFNPFNKAVNYVRNFYYHIIPHEQESSRPEVPKKSNNEAPVKKYEGSSETIKVRKSEKRPEVERADRERDYLQREREHQAKERERLEKERREKERLERERQARLEKERREKERLERERLEKERQEKERQEMMEFERIVLQCSEIVPDTLEDCHIALYTEKKEGLGEDSTPLIYRNKNTMCVGVFDGMGGAGSTEYPTLTIGNKTGAYLSSRIVRAVCYNWLMNNGKFDSSAIKEEISRYFNYILSIWNVKSSGLRSGFVRVLPTTLAVIEASKKGGKTEVSSYWAGDSRNYVLSASGLKQLSIDDLRQPKDPLENLRSDDALSNCICQDKPFHINVQQMSFNEPIIILSATDGCFGYLLTPMHFEYILLDCLMKSSNCKEWSEAIYKTLSPISSDDFTIGLQIVDEDFGYWQKSLHVRYELLKESVIQPLDQIKAKYEKAIKECVILEKSLYNRITESWQQYKEEFMLTNLSYHNDN